MDAFTPEQWEFLKAMSKVHLSATDGVLQAVRDHSKRIGVLQGLLLTKGMITEEELEVAIKETEAAVMVEEAVHPELARLQEEFNRIVYGTQDRPEEG